MYGSVTPRVPVGPGDLVTLHEGDHRYGHGTVTLLITRVRVDISLWYDGEWVWIEGLPVLPDGSHGRPHTVLARVSALRARAA